MAKEFSFASLYRKKYREQTRIFKLALKGSTAIVLSLFAWELILGSFVEKSSGFTTHPVLGRIPNSGAVVQGKEGFSRTTINSLGMRGGEISPKAKGEYRVLALGDSFTSAEHVANSKTYSALLASNLKASASANVTTVNAGRAGTSPAYYLALAEFYESQIQPNAVVVQLNDGDFTKDALDSSKEFYISQTGNAFQAVRNEKFSSDDPLSQLVQQRFPQLKFLLEYSIVRVGGKNIQSMLKDKTTSTANAQSAPTQSQNYDALVEWVVINLKARYPNVVLFHIPFPDYHNLAEPPSSIETTLAKFTAKHGVRFVAMRQDFIGHYRSTYQPSSGFNNTTLGIGHTNETGHALIAKRLSEILQKDLQQ